MVFLHTTNNYSLFIQIVQENFVIYKIKKDEKEISKILDKALIAHNKVKGNYNVQYMIFDEELEKNLEREHEIELNMQKALINRRSL